MKNHFVDNVITISTVQKSDSGALTLETVYTKKSKRKKARKGLRTVDKLVRRIVRASAVGANELADRHERSSEKKRGGGLRDMGKNMVKATRKASKQIPVLKKIV